MKKIVAFVLVALLAAVPVSARTIAPGTLELSGATELSYSNVTTDVDGVDEDTKTTSLAFSGNFYPLPNFGIGALVEVINTDSEGDEATSTLVGPQAIYQFEIAEAANLYAKAAIGYNQIEVDFDGGSEDADGMFWAVGAGLKYFPAANASMDVGLAYSSQTFEDSDIELDVTALAFSVGFSIYIP